MVIQGVVAQHATAPGCHSAPDPHVDAAVGQVQEEVARPATGPDCPAAPDPHVVAAVGQVQEEVACPATVPDCTAAPWAEPSEGSSLTRGLRGGMVQ